MERIRVVQFGLGPIGIESAFRVFSHPRLELVGAVDIDPAKVGKDVGAFFSQPQGTAVNISNQGGELVKNLNPQVVLHTTQSSLATVFPQLEAVVNAGAHVISSTEELLFPWLKNPDLASRLDVMARDRGVVVLGTGVNPGFIMDTLILLLSAVCADVKSVRAERFVNAGLRRLPLQRKVGAGLSVDEFRRRVAAGTMGHVGMRESVALVAHGLNWKLDEILETVDPVVAENPLETPFLKVRAGEVAGIRNVGIGLTGSKEVIKLDLRMYVGCCDPHDSIELEGNPPIRLRIDDGVFGDLATVAMLINSIPGVLGASPGLKTMVDLPIPHYFS